jgi:hypothetical protein
VLGEDQFGFRRGRGTTDAIGMLRIISERTLGIGEEFCACLINFPNEFDCVNWTKLMQTLKNTSIGCHEIRFSANCTLYSVKMRLYQGETRNVKIGRGVRQGCCLSPILFKLYSSYVKNEGVEWFGDFRIGVQEIRTVKYTDNFVLLAKR